MTSVKNVQRRLLNSNNEIELFELFRLLWGKKWFISLVTGISVVIGITFIKLSHPIYEVTAILSPPSLSAVESINAGRTIEKYTLINPLKRVDIYNIFKEHLNSGATKQELLTYLSHSSSVNAQLNSNNLSLPSVSAGSVNSEPLSKQFVSIRYTDAKRAVELAIKYVEVANRNAVDELLSMIKTQNNIVVSELRSRVNVARLKKEEFIGPDKKYGHEVQNGKAINDIVSHSENNFHTNKKLNTNLPSVPNDISQLIYNSRVREMQENVEFYKNLKVDTKTFLYRLDGEIVTPITPISPRKKFILFLSAVLGLIGGISFVFLKSLIAERKIIL